MGVNSFPHTVHVAVRLRPRLPQGTEGWLRSVEHQAHIPNPLGLASRPSAKNLLLSSLQAGGSSAGTCD